MRKYHQYSVDLNTQTSESNSKMKRFQGTNPQSHEDDSHQLPRTDPESSSSSTRSDKDKSSNISNDYPNAMTSEGPESLGKYGKDWVQYPILKSTHPTDSSRQNQNRLRPQGSTGTSPGTSFLSNLTASRPEVASGFLGIASAALAASRAGAFHLNFESPAQTTELQLSKHSNPTRDVGTFDMSAGYRFGYSHIFGHQSQSQRHFSDSILANNTLRGSVDGPYQMTDINKSHHLPPHHHPRDHYCTGICYYCGSELNYFCDFLPLLYPYQHNYMHESPKMLQRSMSNIDVGAGSDTSRLSFYHASLCELRRANQVLSSGQQDSPDKQMNTPKPYGSVSWVDVSQAPSTHDTHRVRQRGNASDVGVETNKLTSQQQRSHGRGKPRIDSIGLELMRVTGAYPSKTIVYVRYDG